MKVNRLTEVAGEELLPQIRLLLIGAVIGAVLFCISLGVMLSGANAPETPRLPSISPPSVPGLPPGLPTDLPTGLPTDLPTDFPTDFSTDLIPPPPPPPPAGLSIPGGGS